MTRSATRRPGATVRCRTAARCALRLGSADGAKPRPGVALPDWQKQARRAPRACPAELRLLAPFDPIIRDRKRLTRLFAFDYRFEAFTPAAKRRYGYYVMPILEGDRFVGRFDPRRDSARKALVVDAIWWEPGVRPTRARKRAFGDALQTAMKAFPLTGDSSSCYRGLAVTGHARSRTG